jgi:hypothetical protein
MYPPEYRASNRFARKGIAPSPTKQNIVADTRGIFCFAGMLRRFRSRMRLNPGPSRLIQLLICASILIASVRLASPSHSPASALNSFQGAGHFSLLVKQIENNNKVWLRMHNDQQRQINDLKLRQGQLPGVSKP